MTYQNKSQLFNILKQYNLTANKNFGQNFLINPHYAHKIIESANLTPTDTIIEIGPGLGFLTQFLLQSPAKQIISIDIDPTFQPILTTNLPQTKFTFINQDILTYIPTATHYKILANIPYYITSPIINHFLKQATTFPKPELMILMVQKEVASKICASPGNHSILSLQVQAYAKPKILCTVPKSQFHPSPKVESALIKLTPLSTPIITNETTFFNMIHTCFSQKRKTLTNTLSTFWKLPKQQTEQLLTQHQISPTIRPQELTLEQWNQLIQIKPT